MPAGAGYGGTGNQEVSLDKDLWEVGRQLTRYDIPPPPPSHPSSEAQYSAAKGPRNLISSPHLLSSRPTGQFLRLPLTILPSRLADNKRIFLLL